MKNNAEKTGVTIKEAKTEENPTLLVRTGYFNIGGHKANKGFKKQLLKELVTMEEHPQNAQYNTLNRVKETLNSFNEIGILKVYPSILNFLGLSYLFIKDTYLYNVGEFKVNLNVNKKLFGEPVIIYSYLLFDEIKTVIIFNYKSFEDIKEELEYIGADTPENEDYITEKIFKGDDLKTLEAIKKARENPTPQVKPIEDIKPAYYIYREIERQGETKELLYCLQIAQGKTDLRPDIYQRYEARTNELIKEGQEKLIRQREAKEEAKEKIREQEDYYMKDLLF